jgi:ABC-type transport system substrate-binding protein
MTHPDLKNPRRRAALVAGAALLGASAGPAWAQAAATPEAGAKVLRYAFRVAETGLDPAKVSDLYSGIVIAHLYESLYTYDYLARPVKIKPLTAVAMPQVSDDFKVFTIQVQPGIFFSDDAAFKGQKRELTAADYLYAIKRFADPANKSPRWSDYEELNFVGLNALREAGIRARKPFDYDHPVAGLQLLDRFTLRLEVANSRPRLLEALASGDTLGGFAREIDQFYGERAADHPVGTGPFRLAEWRRSSRMVLQAKTDYRLTYQAEPAADDVEGQALLARFKGKRLPMIDRVEVDIIEEDQPRWLSFLNGQHNFLETLPVTFCPIAIPGDKVAPHLARQGMRAYRSLNPDVQITTYNMEDPVIGGYTPEKVALRRAINLAVDVPTMISLIRNGQGIVAQSMIVPHTSGYDPHFKSEMGDHDPARARALLDLYGYLDRNGDGWRELPDGRPLKLRMMTQPDQLSRQQDNLWLRSMREIGIQIEFAPAQWPENLKAAQAGTFQLWDLANSASKPDGQDVLTYLYGPAAGNGNLSRFAHAPFDDLFRRMQSLPDGPEREALFLQAKLISVAYAPYKAQLHRDVTDMSHAEVQGYRRPLFWADWWQYVHVNAGATPHSPA